MNITATMLALALFSGSMVFAVQPASAQQQQKLELVANLLDRSPVAARIDASDHSEAKAALGAARTLYVQATGDLRAGNLAAADRALNEALALIGKAQALVPDPAVADAAQGVRYRQLMASVESVQASYLYHLPHVGGRPDSDMRWQAISRLVDSARNYAGNGSFARANRLLIQAEGDLLAALELLLGRTTIQYEHHFSDPKDEFTHELARNRSYRELVPLAISELSPGMDAVRLADRYLNTSLALRGQAEKLASQRDLNGALENIRRSTSELQRALLAVGLVVPKE